MGLRDSLDALHHVILLRELARELAEAMCTMSKRHKLNVRQAAASPGQLGTLWLARAHGLAAPMYRCWQRSSNLHHLCVRLDKARLRAAGQYANARCNGGACQADRNEECSRNLSEQGLARARAKPWQLCEGSQALTEHVGDMQPRLSARHCHADLVQPCTAVHSMLPTCFQHAAARQHEHADMTAVAMQHDHAAEQAACAVVAHTA